jgi:hypothetical protein
MTDEAVEEIELEASKEEAPAATEEEHHPVDGDAQDVIASPTSESSSTRKKRKAQQAPLTEIPAQPLPKIPLWIKDWTATILIGGLVVSHWRGLWTLFDIWTCQQPEYASGVNGGNFCFVATYATNPEDAQTRLESGIFSYWLGVTCTVVGVSLIWAGLWTPLRDKVSWKRAVLRFVIVYILGFAAVNQWRGIWYITDEVVKKGYPLVSNWITTVAGAGGAFFICCGGSLLAPPAIFLVDGPGLHQPPIAVTLLSSYFALKLPAEENTPPPKNIGIILLDIIVSFFGLPILVVWYWRGCWQLQDLYFWGLTGNEHDLLVSLGWSALLGLICTVLASEPLVHFIPDVDEKQQYGMTLFLIGRLRTMALAVGAVSFWRIIWTLWDLGGTTNASAWTSEVVSIFLLTAMGCVSCITAPPSTLGVDVTPNPKSADEPLFAMLPIPWEILYWWGIGRNPCVAQVELVTCEIGLVDIEEQEIEQKTSFGILPSLESVRSWRPGLVREEAFYYQVSTRYFECQHPDLEGRQCTEYCQNRPGLHQRKRSQFFRNR